MSQQGWFAGVAAVVVAAIATAVISKKAGLSEDKTVVVQLPPTNGSATHPPTSGGAHPPRREGDSEGAKRITDPPLSGSSASREPPSEAPTTPPAPDAAAPPPAAPPVVAHPIGADARAEIDDLLRYYDQKLQADPRDRAIAKQYATETLPTIIQLGDTVGACTSLKHWSHYAMTACSLIDVTVLTAVGDHLPSLRLLCPDRAVDEAAFAKCPGMAKTADAR